MPELKLIYRAVQRARRRLWLIRGVGGALRAAFYLTLAAALLMAFHRLTDTNVAWGPVALGLGVLAVLVGLTASFLPRLSLMTAAVEVDARAGWKERVSSLMSLPSISDPMERALLSDVRGRITGVRVRSLFPFSLPRETRWIPVGLLAIVGAFFLPNLDLFGTTAEEQTQKDNEERVSAAVERLEKRARNIKKQVGHKPMERALAAGERLDKLARKMMDSPPTRRQMLESISSEREKLREDLSKLQTSRGMAEKLQQSMQGRKGETGKLGDLIKKGQFKKAAEELARMRQKLNEGSMTEQEQQQLAQNLGALMDRLTQSQNAEALSDFEKAMGDALQSVQNQSDSGMEDLQEMFDNMASDLAESDMLDSMMQDLETMADELAQGDGSCPYCGQQNDGLQREGAP